MYQIDTPRAVSVMPSPTAVGTPGFFTDGNPALGVPSTILPAEFVNSMMMELLNVLSGAGITPDKTAFDQVQKAIKVYAKKRQLQQIGASVASNALTLTYAGDQLDFRSTTSSGVPIQGVVVPANSMVVPVGATLGTVAGQVTRLVLLEAYNGGAPVLCVVNLSGGVLLDESNLISPTTISAAATSANVIYSASAVSAGSPYRVVGYIDIAEAAPGTWATAPTLVQGVGGQALAALASLGYGQTPQAVSRVAGVTYYNATGRPIGVSIYWSAPSQVQADLRVAGAIVDSSSNVGAGGFGTGRAIVPPGASYSISGTGISIGAAYEFR